MLLLQDGDMDSRWSCGPLATGWATADSEDCEVDFSLNYYRYVRQIQIGALKLFEAPAPPAFKV